jgi:hypothetical protein
VNGLDDEARAIALGIADTFQEAKAKAKMAIGYTAGLVWEDLNTINNYLGDPRNGWLGMNPLGRSLQEGVGLTSALLGKIVFHGSPHKFEKFAMSKIGTGEGAQAYGHGLYFAENQAVANQYKNLAERQFVDGPLNWDNPIHVGIRASDLAGGREAGIARLSQTVTAKTADAKNKDIAQKAIEFLKSGEPFEKYAKGGGHTYNVDLPDESIAKMLDWDKPLSQQPENVRKYIQGTEVYKDRLNASRAGYLEHPDKATGNQWLSFLRDEPALANMPPGSVPQRIEAETLLKQAGIPGIKYLDAGSRGTGGTSNYVVFDEELPKIVGRE